MARGAAVAMWATVLMLADRVASQPAEPPSFRGIALGSTLTELRRVRFPEMPAAQIICTHDEETSEIRSSAEFELSPEQLEAGIVVCGAFVFARPFGPTSNTLPAEWLLARIDVGGIEMSPRFWFAVTGGDGNSEARLYRIAMHTNSAHWDAVRAGFIARYGGPARSDAVKSPAEFGKLDNVRLVWSGGGAMLTLTKRLNLPNRLAIEFDLPALKPVGG